MEHHTKMGINRFTELFSGASARPKSQSAGAGVAAGSLSATPKRRPRPRPFWETLNNSQHEYVYATNPYENKQFDVGITPSGKAKLTLTPDAPHVLIHGATGTGKTWLAQRLIDQALDKPFQGKILPPQHRWQIIVIASNPSEWDKYTGNQNVRIFEPTEGVLPQVSKYVESLPKQTNTLLVLDRSFSILEERESNFREQLAPLLDAGAHLIVCESRPLSPEWVKWLRPGNVAVFEARDTNVHTSLAKTYPEFAMLATPPVQNAYDPKEIGSYWAALRTPRRLEPLVWTDTLDDLLRRLGSR